ncbi:MAG TPA: SNF2-related protein, partial [Smithellaceae bacterium]|nr:SNF2-related protein [Smithellaceae bacterium]
MGEKRLGRIKGMLTLRQMAYDLVNAERFDLPGIEEKRKELNNTYDAFVKEYGYLSENANFSLMSDDVKIEFGLENGFVKEITAARAKVLGIAPSPARAEKATILTERMFYPDKEILYAKNPMDGYSISLSQKGRLDLDYISQLTGKTKDEVIRQLSKEGLIYQDPETKEWIQEDEYLSGNVKGKYKKVAGKEGFEKNAEALKKAFPPDKPTEKIFANPGAPWIPTRYYEQFGEFIGLQDVRVTLYRDTGHFNMSAGGIQQNDINVEWQNEYFSLDEMFNAVANNKVLIAYDGRGDDRVQNKRETKILANHVKEMRSTFYDWIFADDARARDLTKIYNDTQNTHAERVYRGEHLKTVGANPAIILRNTQRNAAWRIIQSAKVLLDHCVGAGKTFTIITGVQERVRMGLTRKSMIVVPNHLVGQWAADYMKLYPGARILAATKKDFTRSNRRRLFARIATGKYDAVIVGHSSFGFIPIETESVTNLIMEEIEHLERAHAQAEESGDKRLIKSLAKRIQKKRERINELLGRERDNVTNFEAMGIDHLVIDESHEFKNLEYSSSMQNITGMGNPMGSKKAFDLYSKIRWLTSQEKHALTFATGTPISNSLVELYALLRYMNREALVARGLEAFDAWASSYAAIENKIEYTATQKLKDRTIMSTFNNLRELLQLYKEFADTVTMDDLKRIYAEQIRERNARTGGNESEEFPIPHVEGGGRVLDVADATEEQSEFVDYLVARAETLEEQGGSADPKIDNHLWIMSDARKMALDIRLVDPYAPDHPNNKINRAVRSIKEIYDKTTDVRGTQLVFCDLSTPSGQARKNADSFIREALKKARLDGDRQVKIIMGTLGTYQDKWGYIRNRLEAEIDAISEHALAETDQYMKRREEIEEFLEKTGDDVVADLTTADTGFSVYDEMKSKLIDMGIPEGEIRFIHDATSDPKKQEMFDLVNAGKVRVLIGSSMKMGAGMNVQERLVALHHMDAPWRPSDVEQREGRAVRQGNKLYEADPKGFTVAVKAYSTKNTFDAVMWGILARKAAMLDDFRNGADSVTDTSTDGASFALFMASSTNNPAFLEKFELEGELEILNALKRKTQTRLRSAKQSLEYNKKAREREKDFIARREEILEGLKDKSSFTYKGKTYEDKAKKIVREAQEEIYAYNRSVDKEYNEAYDTAIKEAFGKLGIEAPKRPDGNDYTDRDEFEADWKTYNDFWQKKKNEKIAAEAVKGIKKKPHKHLHYDKLAKSDKSGAIAAGLEMLQEINDLDVGGVFSFKLGDVNISIEKMESSKLRGEGSEAESFDFVVTAGGSLGDGIYVGRAKNVKAFSESYLWEATTVSDVQTHIESGLADNKRNVAMMDREDETSRDTLEKLRFKDEEKLKTKTERYAAVLEEVRAAEAEMDARRAEQSNKYIEQDTTRFPHGYNPRRDNHEAPGPTTERIEADIDNVDLNDLRRQRDEISGGIGDGNYEEDDLTIKFAEMARAEAILSRYGDGNIQKAQSDLQEAKKGWDEFHEGEEYPYEIKLAEHIITSINNKQGKLFKGQQYNIGKGNGTVTMPTLKDVQEAFKGQEV